MGVGVGVGVLLRWRDRDRGNDFLAARYEEKFSKLWKMMNQRTEVTAVNGELQLFEKSPASAYAHW